MTGVQTCALPIFIAAEKEVKAEKAAEASVKTKTRLAILIRGDAALQQAVAAGAYVLSVPDDDTVSNTYMAEGLLNRVIAAAKEHNEAPRPRRGKSKRSIKTLNDAMTLLKAKTIKASGSQFSIKQKGMPVEVVVVTKEELL